MRAPKTLHAFQNGNQMDLFSIITFNRYSKVFGFVFVFFLGKGRGGREEGFHHSSEIHNTTQLKFSLMIVTLREI